MITLFKRLENTLWKATRKRDKRLAKARSDRHKKLQASLEKMQINRAIYQRDRGKCRVCDALVYLITNDDWAKMHPHHIVYASALGSDELPNRCALCLKCHALEHEHLIGIVGNGNKTLSVTFYEPKTFKILRMEERPCPS